ncbi:telomeric repeat-binding factor 1-like [Ostrea edulis]|uniref:telomeric repeat-binding factor 1-like n=1 Tax=Ostrea edulis TaxID=37623 RepID=UPI0024AEBC86|nr:telomeric repeat-binding factor 1-like [Ostrea edulis]
MMEENRQIVNRWILEFTLSMIWKDFVEYGTVDRMNNRDLIQWIVAQKLFEEEKDLRQIYILSLICRLVDGEVYEMKYTEDSKLTVLEDAADVLKILLTDMEEPLLKEGRDLLDELKLQAVYVCCRDDNFEAAEEVYNRQFSSSTVEQARTRSENKENNQEILKLLKSQNPQHSTLNSQKYQLFLSRAQKFLQQFIKAEEPVLLQMAERQWKPERTELRPDKYQDKRVNLGTLMKVQRNIGVPEDSPWPNFMEHRDLKEHVQKVNAEKGKHTDTNVNADSVSPRKSSSPKKRKLSESSHSQDISYKSLGTRIYEKHHLSPSTVLNADIPKLNVWHREQSRQTTGVPSSPPKRHPWLDAEVNDFYRCVQIHGVGNWNKIKDAMNTSRSNVHLKDKWRTIMKSREIDRLRRKFGPVKI